MNIALIKDRIEESPTTSVRKLAAQAYLKRESVRLILKKELSLKPYRIGMLQELSHNDNEKRLQICSRIKDMSQQRQIDINTLIFSDECHIYLQGFMNKPNYRMWSTQKPMELFEKPLHSQKVTIWCGLSSHRIYGPFFFEDETGNARTVNSEFYIEMLNALMTDNIDPDVWFQQDGATALTSNQAID